MDNDTDKTLNDARFMAIERCLSAILGHLCFNLDPEQSNRLRSEIADASLNPSQNGEWDGRLEAGIRAATLALVREAEKTEVASREKYGLPSIRRCT